MRLNSAFARRPPNKGMKLTKLSAAPTLAPQAALGRRCRLMPAPSTVAAGTASQLIWHAPCQAPGGLFVR